VVEILQWMVPEGSHGRDQIGSVMQLVRGDFLKRD
jgi:hypothetical protein